MTAEINHEADLLECILPAANMLSDVAAHFLMEKTNEALEEHGYPYQFIVDGEVYLGVSDATEEG